MDNGQSGLHQNEKKINAGAFMTLPLLYREEFQLERDSSFYFFTLLF